MTLNESNREQTAKELVDEALAGFEGKVPAKELAAIRLLLEMELLTTKAGAETLRSVSADPHVERSGAVEKEPAAKKGRKAGGEP